MPLLEEEEITAIIRAFEQGHDAPIDEDGATVVVRWAEQVRVDTALLENVLDGSVLIDINQDGEVIFKISEKGREAVERGMGLPPMSRTDGIVQ